MSKKERYIRNIDIILMSFIFLLLFILPLIFVKAHGETSWPNVIKIWQDRVLLIPLFIINHWILVPRLVLKKKYTLFIVLAVLLITLVSTGYFYIEKRSKPDNQPPRPKNEYTQNQKQEKQNIKPNNQANFQQPRKEPPPSRQEFAHDRPKKPRPKPKPKPINPIPPYADLLLFSLLIISVDTGLSFTKHWHDIEEDKNQLEKENIQAQLGILRNQISPHFFMNTLNNIYSLAEADKKRSKEAIMKLSKLMRYLLYENKEGKVLLSKELEFIRSYIDLMKLRFADDVEINFKSPEIYNDIEIPVLIFISYIENAFKYGASYQQKSVIDIAFDIDNKHLYFACMNTIHVFSTKNEQSGIGLENSKRRLDLLFKNRYDLKIDKTDETYIVKLKIPLA